VDTLTEAQTASAVRALMRMNTFGLDNDALAAALDPIVPALPPLPEGWEGEEGEDGTPEQYMQFVAELFLDAHREARGGDYPVPAYMDSSPEGLRRKFERAQNHGLQRAAEREIGEIPGYLIWARVISGSTISDKTTCIEVYEQHVSPDLVQPLVTMPLGATRRDVEMAVLGWRSGFDLGTRRGQEKIRNGIKELLDIDTE
jgi:hypothetical protein